MIQNGETPAQVAPYREHPAQQAEKWEKKWNPKNFETKFIASQDEDEKKLATAKEIPVRMRRIELNRAPNTELTTEEKQYIRQHGLQVAVNITGFGQSGKDISASDNSFYESAGEEFAQNNKTHPLGVALNVDLPQIPPKELGKTYRADAMAIEAALQEQVRTHLIENLGFTPDDIAAMPCLYNSIYIESFSEGSGIALAFAARVDKIQKEAMGKLENTSLPKNKFVAFSPTNLLTIPGTSAEKRFYMMGAFVKEVMRIAGYEVAGRVNAVDNLGFDLIKDKQSLVHNLVRLINMVHTPENKKQILSQVQEAASGNTTMLKMVIERASASPSEMGNQMQKFLSPNKDARNQLGGNWNIALLLPANEATGVDFQNLVTNENMIKASLGELPPGPEGTPNATPIKKLLQTNLLTDFFAQSLKVSPSEFRHMLADDYDPFINMIKDLFTEAKTFVTDADSPPHDVPYSLMERLAHLTAGAGTLGEIGNLLLSSMGVENSILQKLASWNESALVKSAAKKMPASENVKNAPIEYSSPRWQDEMNMLATGLFPNSGDVHLVCFEEQTHTMIEEIPTVLKTIKDAIHSGEPPDTIQNIPFKIFFGKKIAAPHL